jgi:hypothetical protein
MKKIAFILLLAATTGYGQAPALFNYQGVARNAVGNVLILWEMYWSIKPVHSG